MVKTLHRSSERQAWIAIMSMILLSWILGQATKPVVASEAVSGIAPVPTSTTEVDGCPDTCKCVLPNADELYITDCRKDPKEDLHQVLDSHPHIIHLKIARSLLGKLTYNLSKLNQLTHVELQQNHLSVFPCQLSNLTQLSFLNISENRIRSVPCDFSNMTNLASLDLSGNLLNPFPCELSALLHLTSLDIASNNLLSVNCDLSNLTMLTSLNLSQNIFSIFPCTLSTLTKLASLDLSNNQIQSVSCDLSNLSNLISLNISWNLLNTFPCELSTLMLTSLDLSNNKIKTADCDFSHLTRPISLYLMDNQFNRFPCKLSTITNLTSLDISFNNISSVACHLSNLTILTSLNLMANQLSRFPCELLTLTQLTSLDISSNQLHSVECDLSRLTNLNSVNLTENQLFMFPCELSKITQLTYLYISHNQIKSVECDVSILTSLTILDLSFNSLITFPCDLATLPMLTSLDISSNKIYILECKPNDIRYNYTFLSSNQTMYVQCDLSYCTQTEQRPVQCDLSNVTKLTHLDLSDNIIHVLDSWPLLLAHKGILKNLSLDGNLISQFTNYAGAPAKLCRETNLVISLRHNSIKHYMDIIRGWNFTASTDDELHDCLNFFLEQYLGNPLSCDCVDYEIYKLIQNKSISYKQFKCREPHRLRGKDPTHLPLDQFICDISTRKKCPIGCECIDSPFHQSISINCEHFNGTTLPEHVPNLSKGTSQYDLNFHNGDLSEITLTPYLRKVSKANFSGNSIFKVSVNAFQALQNVSLLYLDQNKMQRLPAGITHVNLSNTSDLKFGKNPWVCDCTILETKKWMENNEASIVDVVYVTCVSPRHMHDKNILDIDNNVFCTSGTGHIITYSLIAVGLFILVPLVCLIRRMKKQFTFKQVRKQMDTDVDKEFDVFVSYASEDEDYILDEFIPRLENHNVKVCCHRVHFLGGNTIVDNISECINNSKRTLVFFSNFYKNSRFCMWEFREARNKDLRDDTMRVIILKDSDLDMTDLDVFIKDYFERCTYIEKGAVRFWENLLYSLPRTPANVEDFEAQEL